jgi:hypothetical protein
MSLSLVTQTGLLENLHSLDTMIVEEVAKKGRHTITRLGARFVERRTSLAVGARVRGKNARRRNISPPRRAAEDAPVTAQHDVPRWARGR